MKYTPNISLPIVENGDLYSKEINNLAFNQIDEQMQGLRDALTTLDNVDGSILETKEEVKALSESLDSITNDYMNISTPIIDSTFYKFTKIKAYRNNYNSKIDINKITTDSTMNLGTPPPVGKHSGDLNHIIEKDNTVSVLGTKNGIVFTNSNTIKGSVRLDCGKIKQYSTFEIRLKQINTVSGDFTSCQFGIRDETGTKQIIITVKKGTVGAIEIESLINYVSTSQQVLKSSYIHNNNDIIRFTLIKNYLLIYLINDSTEEFLGKYSLSAIDDFNLISNINQYRYFVGARLKNSQDVTIDNILNYYSCGVGQCDPYLITYEDKTPIIKDNKMFVSMTTRFGYGLSVQGIYELELGTLQTKLVGILNTINTNSKNELRNNLANQILFDRNTKEFIVLGVSTDYDHKLEYSKTKKNLLSGYNIVETKRLNYNFTSDDEDGSLVYKNGKWHLAYCGFNNTTGFNLVLCSALSIDDNFIEYARNTDISFTGATWTKIADKYYISCGKCWGDNIIDKLYLYQEDGLTEVGTSSFKMDYPPLSYNTWACIIPRPNGVETEYILMTFDRNNVLDSYSYGALYFYISDKREYGYIHNKYFDLNLI